RSSGPLHVLSSGQQEPARRESQPVTSPAAPGHSRRKSYYYAAAALLVLGAVTGGFFLFRSSQSRPPASKDWEQLTFFTDSAVYPALSPDGRMLAFIRGTNSFFGLGQVYVKFLPDDQPLQHTAVRG